MRLRTRSLTDANAIHSTFLGKWLFARKMKDADPVMLRLLERSLDIEQARVELEQFRAENRRKELELREVKLREEGFSFDA